MFRIDFIMSCCHILKIGILFVKLHYQKKCSFEIFKGTYNTSKIICPISMMGFKNK
jgi:hypothetical protein